MGFLKNILTRFRGGPDFAHCLEIDAVFSDYQLVINLPITNVKTEEPPRPINFPIDQAGWFEANADNDRQHHHVHIYTELWYYLAKGLTALFSELGMLSVRIMLKRIPPEQNVNALDLDALGQHCVAEYDEFYNSPVLDESWLGENTRIAQETTLECKQNTNLTDEEIKEEIEKDIIARGYPRIAPHEIKTLNGRDYVFYLEHKIRTLNKQHLYCLPINKEFYLCFRFKYQVDIGTKFKLWKDHAEAAEKRIMESVRLEKTNSTSLLENVG